MATATTTAFVHTVGIIMLSYSLSSDGHLQAVAPRIDESLFEPHTALLAFRTQDVQQGGNWTPQSFDALPGYSYLTLSGERIDLLDGLPQATAAPPPASIEGLPGLSSCCPSAQLKEAFKEPFSGAEAVLDFPVGNTVTNTCGAVIAGATAQPESKRRIDTLVSVKNNGTLIVRSRGQDKELRLDGRARLYFAHIPTAALEDPAHQPTGTPHYKAYFDMLDMTGCPAFLACQQAAGQACESVVRKGSPPSGTGRAKREIDFSSMIHIDYQCSNSQWP